MKIAILSDIHFGKLARTKEFSLPGYEIKGEATNACSLTDSLVDKLTEQRVEYIFICGDLTSCANPLEFHYCANKIKEIASSAGIPEKNIIWCIGNHDVDWKITGIPEKPENKDYAGILSADDSERLKDSYRLSALNAAKNNTSTLPELDKEGPVPLSGVIDAGKFVVFVLNSAVFSTHDQKIKHGILSKEQLDWFADVSSDYKNRWKIVVAHHHPIPYRYPTTIHDISQMEDGAELVEIAYRNGIDLVIHGHRHHPYACTQKNEWGKPITFICSGSLSVNADERGGEIPNMFHILELSDSIGALNLYNYEYSESDGWKAVRYRKEAPLDSEMFLGKVFDPPTLESAARTLWESFQDHKKISKSNLPEELKYCVMARLIEILEETKPSADSSVYYDPQKMAIILFKEQ